MSIRIIKSTDTGAVDALLSPRHDEDAATRKAVIAIVEGVRKGGDKAVARYARKFDGLRGPAEIPRDQWTLGARQAAPDVRRAIGAAARNIARVARAQVPRPRPFAASGPWWSRRRCSPTKRFTCSAAWSRRPEGRARSV